MNLKTAFYTTGENVIINALINIKADEKYLNLVMEFVPETLSKTIR